MMTRIWGTVLIIILLGASLRCIQEIPFAATEGAELMVVNGGITNLDEDHIVYLSRTVKYGVPPVPLTNCVVTLHESNTSSWQFFEPFPGKYVLPAGFFKATVGSVYYLKIILQNGDEYQSDPEMILPPVQPDSISWTVNREAIKSKDGFTTSIDAVQLFINTLLPENQKDTYLRWVTQSAYQFTTMPECSPFRTVYTCHYSKFINPGNLYIYDNHDIGENEVRQYKIGFEAIDPNYRFMETHYYSVYQYRISDKAYDYYRKLDLVANQNGSIFDAIPASIQSNVYNVRNESERVLGYFQAASAAVIRLRLVPSDFTGKYGLLSKEQNLCGWLRGAIDSKYFVGCCNCSALPDQEVTKPDWW